jgi:hypothetical protein
MVRFSVEYTADGRSVSAHEWRESIKRKLLDQAMTTMMANIKTKVEAVQGPDHHVRARVTGQTQTGSFAVEGCCDKLAQMTRAALR